MERRLRRSDVERIVAGVCGGLAEYLTVDPVLVRLAWVLFTLFGGSGVLAYLLAWVIVPDSSGRRASLPVALLIVLFAIPFTCLWCLLLSGLFVGFLGAGR
jgi:phage shock protein C